MLLVAAFGVAGLVSAKGNENIDEKFEKKKQEQKAAVRECGVLLLIG